INHSRRLMQMCGSNRLCSVSATRSTNYTSNPIRSVAAIQRADGMPGDAAIGSAARNSAAARATAGPGLLPSLDRRKPDRKDEGVTDRFPRMHSVGPEDYVIAFLCQHDQMPRVADMKRYSQTTVDQD